MKLRLHKNSLRLRLGPEAVERFRDEGRVEAVVRFGPAEAFVYALELAPIEAPRVALGEHRLTVRVPHALAEEWATTDRVGFAAEQPAGEGAPLRLLVEKDFACLHTSDPHDEPADRFPRSSVTAS